MEGYVHGHRSKGRPKRRWMDGVKEDCAHSNSRKHRSRQKIMEGTGEEAVVACYCIAWAPSKSSQARPRGRGQQKHRTAGCVVEECHVT